MSVLRPSIWCRIYLRPPPIGDSDEDQLVTFECAPSKVSVTCNAHHEADTFELEFDLETYPFDPRLIRGATVEIYVDDLSSDAAQRSAKAYWQGLSFNDMQSRCLIAGVADLASNEWGDDGRTLSLKGRDYTAYFLDTPLADALRYSSKSFVEIIADLIRQQAKTRDLALELIAGGESVLIHPALPEPVAAQAAGANATIQSILGIRPVDYKPRYGPDPKDSEQKPREGESTWDAIHDVALQAGFVVYVELDRVVIREPSTLAPSSALAPGTFYRFTLGGNVKRYEPERRLGQQREVQVQVSSFDPVAGRSLFAIKPTDAELKALNPGGAGAIGDEESKRGEASGTEVKATPFVVRNVTSQAALQRIADGIYEQLRVHDIEVGLSTDEMHDSGLRPLWGMRYADAVVVDIAASLESVFAFPVGKQLEHLRDKGFKVGDMDGMVGRGDALEGFLGQLNLPFILSECTYRYDSDDGWSVDMVLRGRRQVRA